MARWGSRVALIALGIGLALGALEAALQLGALALSLTTAQTPAVWMTGRRRILCVGDSNTYGLYLRDRALAYPQQLERLWNAPGASPQVEVLNLGYPGTNSSRLRRDLPRMLQTLRPDVVVIMVGSNDYWTAEVSAAPADGAGDRIARLLEHSRVYQLAHMLGRALDQRRLEVVYPVTVEGGRAGVARFGDVEFPMGWSEQTPPAGYGERLADNVRALADIARAYGAEPVFMTYPSVQWNYGEAGRLVRPAAAAAGAHLVDLAAVFEPVCPTEPCPALLYPDHHPTADGYRLIAETLVRELRR